MARQSGRKGRVYVGIASDTAAAEPLPFIATWNIDFSADKSDVTSMGDNNKVYVAELPDAQGQFTGFYDNATNQTYAATRDGLARKFYLYPNIIETPAQYFFGTIFPDFAVSGGVGEPGKITSKWAAASDITKIG